MIRPERRTKADLIAAAIIALVVVLVGLLTWWTSDARATISRPAATAAPTLTAARQVPPTLAQLWMAASPETTEPVVVGGAVVTAEGATVTGHDPATGDVLWTFARDRQLCGVTYVYDLAVAVYPDIRGCGQVSTIEGSTGQRGPTRTAYADDTVVLTADGATVLSAGSTRIELWRSDMVRMLSYGALDAQIKPETRDQSECRFTSAAASSSLVSVLEACPDEPELRLTFLTVTDEEDTPEVRSVALPGVLPDSGAQVLAVSDDSTAVYLPVPKPAIAVYNETGTEVTTIALTKPPTAPLFVSRPGDMYSWWTGNAVVVFDGNLKYRYTVSAGSAAPLGPATMMAGRILIPLTGGIGVYAAASGAFERVIPVNRPAGTTGPVVPQAAGDLVVEQRGDDVVALG
ncbi:MAG: Rv3212 family protein [Mycobacterium sp.]